MNEGRLQNCNALRNNVKDDVRFVNQEMEKDLIQPKLNFQVLSVVA